ncbi:phage major capsid protein [Aeromonas veronii]|uniref:phage major capsid protein n=1 Tax=Aeromonas veronii TaxID=654 RepID=UPI003D20D279
MDIQETLDLVVTKQAEFNQKNNAAVTAITDEVQAIKSQVTELAETKSALASTQETITALQDQIEQLQDAHAKGIHSMSTTQTQEVKFSHVARELKSAIMAGAHGDIKGVFSSKLPDNAPLYVQGWEAEIIRNLTDQSPILTICGVESKEAVRGLRKRVQVTKSGCRVGVENAANEAMQAIGATGYKWLEAGFTKVDAFNAVTDEAIADGDFDPADMAADTQEAFAIASARAALFGQGEMVGLFAMFGDNKADADRAYDKFQALNVEAGFGKDYLVTLNQLQAVRRALASGYRNGAVWYMNEETFDLFWALKDAETGRPLVKDALTAGYDGQILGYNVVIDRTMPSLSDKGAIPVMFGDFKRAVRFYRVDGSHVVNTSALHAGNMHIYDSFRLGMRMEHSYALKGLRTAAK